VDAPNVIALKTYADTQADAFGIPRTFFSNLIETESGWNPNSVSSKGAQGIAQLMPGTAPEINRFDPYASMSKAASLLKEYYDRFGTWEMAAAAYNAGPGSVTKYSGVPPYPETQNFVAKVMSGLGLEKSADMTPNSSPSTASLTPTLDKAKIVFWAAAVIVLIIVLRGAAK
jgi:soluble lytic murein transglycosylase-like protein